MTPYVNLLLLFLFGAMVTGGLMLASHLLGPHKKSREKGLPYECGIDPEEAPRHPLNVKFYLVAMLFIVFDIEVVFLFPWAVLFKEFVSEGMGMFLFVEMAVFLGVLVVGLLYIYRRRALEWE